MIVSDANQPVKTSAESPDTLPLRGFTIDQLKKYIFRQLVSTIWNIELTEQQVLDQIQDALGRLSIWLPRIKVGSIVMVRGQWKYLENVDVGLGVAKVEFVEPNPVPTEIFYGNLINPAPLFRLGLDEYDTFLRWRKVWKRVTSIQPQWFYDEMERCLYIHNPIERYQAGVFCYFPWEKTEDLNYVSADWVKKYAVASAKYQLAEIWMKFGGAIPGPAQNLQLDNAKREQARQDMTKLMEELKGMQLTTPISID